MNWTYAAFAAIAAGPCLIWYARRKTTEAVVSADQMSETAMWGYFLMLVGAWGALGLLFNMSDLFFALMLVPAVMAGVAKFKGYKPKDNSRPLPDWAAFGFANWMVLAIIGLGKTFVVEPMQIPSSSMRPGLVVGDFIVINKFAYGIRIPFINEVVIPTGKPQRGDVVVFRFPVDPRLNYIKRLIGLPGDTVEYRNKRLTVNGQTYDSVPVGENTYSDKADEKILAVRMRESMPASGPNGVGKQYETLNVPGNPTLYRQSVMDFQHRDACQYDDTPGGENSGFICKIPQGQYLMLGDNRDNSNDGRYWGFVPEGNLAGRAFLIWMNRNDFGRIGTAIN